MQQLNALCALVDLYEFFGVKHKYNLLHFFILILNINTHLPEAVPCSRATLCVFSHENKSIKSMIVSLKQCS